MTNKNILEDLERITIVYSQILLDVANYKQFENTISWQNYKPAIYKSLYFREYEQLLYSKQYKYND